MSNAATDLAKSEKGLLALALIIAATILAAIGKLTWPETLDFYKWIFYAYVAGKTIQGVANGNGLKSLLTTTTTPPEKKE
jgi:hypothetical protein